MSATALSADPVPLQQVRRYLMENHLFTDDEARLQNGDSLLDLGIIDSTGILEVVMFLESTFGITVKDNDLLPDNFDSVNNIVRFVERRRSGG